jgi:chromate transport protein ChrA
MRHTAMRKYARVLEWASVLAGVLIIGSCSTAGFMGSGWLGGLAGLAAAVLVACLLVGAVFLVTTMSGDLADIRRRLQELDPSRAQKPGADDGKDGAPEV